MPSLNPPAYTSFWRRENRILYQNILFVFSYDQISQYSQAMFMKLYRYVTTICVQRRANI